MMNIDNICVVRSIFQVLHEDKEQTVQCQDILRFMPVGSSYVWGRETCTKNWAVCIHNTGTVPETRDIGSFTLSLPLPLFLLSGDWNLQKEKKRTGWNFSFISHHKKGNNSHRNCLCTASRQTSGLAAYKHPGVLKCHKILPYLRYMYKIYVILKKIHSFFPCTFTVVPFKKLYMFCMFCLVPKAGDRTGSEYTMANPLFFLENETETPVSFSSSILVWWGWEAGDIWHRY